MKFRINTGNEQDFPVGSYEAKVTIIANELANLMAQEEMMQELLINEIVEIANCSKEDVIDYRDKSTLPFEKIKMFLLDKSIVFDKEIREFLRVK